ncbi:MAG: hypothetical protein KDC66_22425 [Phaeodactylibacter sp.]|nr:hypothetical protein [Phaeodactylibacter sp.]MCB9276827.1 hypothetical protein [Lewinellaceae bacterium]
MKLYKPQVQLVRRTNVDEPDDYFLHAVTFCGRTSYRADGHNTIPESIDENGVLAVELFLAQDAELPDYDYLTPIVHTIALGRPAAAGEAFVVEVSLTDGGGNRASTDEGNTTTVSSMDADEDSRPIGR